MPACARSEADVEPRFKEWDGQGDLVKFVVSLNLHRRHLNESQRALVGARVANIQVGNPKLIQPNGGIGKSSEKQSPVSIEDAAELLNVGTTSIGRAKTVLKKAVPEIIQAVERITGGRVTRASWRPRAVDARP